MFKKIAKPTIVFIILSCFILALAGCGGNETKTPSEEELVASGLSIKEALPSFKALSDNYMYKERIQQTNGEDWFYFSLVKLDGGNVYTRANRINNNAGWQYEDTIFTDFEDLTEKDYSLFIKQAGNNYFEYRKFKYNDTDEDFVKYYYTDNEAFSINEKAENYFYDYSYFEADYFDYFETLNDNNEKVSYWRVKSELLSDETFKTAFGEGIKQFSSSARLDYVYLFVNENKVTELDYGYYSHVTSNVDLIFHNKIYFDYTNYEFNSNLAVGFDLYEAN